MMVAPAKLAHVVLNTGRLAAMREWYQTVLEAHVVHDAGFAVFLTFDDEHHRLALVDTGASTEQAEEPVVFTYSADWTPGQVFAALAGPPVGLSHTAYTYNSLDELLDTYERLAGKGIRPVLTVNHGPTTSLYYRDPDHHMIELQIDNFPPDEATAFMHSEVFADSQGVGWPFDAEDMLKRHRAGETELLTPWAS